MLLKDELFMIQKRYEAKPPKDIALPFPPQINKSDPLVLVYTYKEFLLTQGTIRFAHIVQANEILFDSFPAQDSAACVVYSTDSYVEEHPELLKEAAQLIFSYKNAPADSIPPVLRDVAATITDEYDRSVHRISLLCREKMVEFVVAPIWIFRKLLPKRKLCSNLIPVFTLDGCNSLLTVPKEYWPFDFARRWKSGRL